MESKPGKGESKDMKGVMDSKKRVGSILDTEWSCKILNQIMKLFLNSSLEFSLHLE